MSIKIALAGNPNCGKTTLFNNLTGSNQYVGNWPGVTVEKKEGKLKGDKDVIIQDLPGIYSLSPYTLEEVVSRTYLVKEKPDAILNIIDGTNIERNLYLTTQLIELGIPVVMAVNMIDLVRKNGDTIDLKKLSAELGCQAVEISALKGEGTEAAAKAAVAAAKAAKTGELPHVFTGSVEHAIAHIEESIQGKVDDRFLRWYAVKLFERDEKVMDELKLDKSLIDHIDQHIKDCEAEMDDDAESIITNQRYAYINTVVGKAVKKKARVEHLTVSDKIDRIVTNRVLALPIFAVVMYLMYSLSMGTSIADGGWAIGTFATPDFMRVGIVGLEQRARRFGRAHERVLPDHAIRGRAPCHGERGHHRGQRHAANIIELQALGRQQRHQFHTELVGGMAFVRGHTPPILQAPVLVDPHYGLRISHVDGK